MPNQCSVIDYDAALILKMARGVDEDVAADMYIAAEVGVEGRKETERLVHTVTEQLRHQIAYLLRRVVFAVDAARDAPRRVAHAVHEFIYLGRVQQLPTIHMFQKFLEFHNIFISYYIVSFASRRASTRRPVSKRCFSYMGRREALGPQQGTSPSAPSQ